MKEVVRAFITNSEGKVLLGKRARNIAAGQFALIGGKPEPEENASQAIIREVAEETGLAFEPTFYLEEEDSSSDQDPWKTTFFTGQASGEINLRKTEITEIVFVSEDDLNKYQIAFNHRQKLIDFFRERDLKK